MAISVGDATLKLSGDTRDLDQALEATQKKVNGAMEKMSKSLRLGGAAFTAVGVAGLALVSSAKKMNAQLGMTGKTIGATTKEMRNLALSTTNVTFPLESVTATFDLLARAGIRDQEVLKKTATAFDTLADATGSSAEEVASQLIPAFKLFGLELPQTAAELDAFTWLTKNSTVELAEFSSIMDYVAQYGDQLNITLEDMVAIMAALESKGKSGSTATKMFRTAVTQAADGSVTLNDALGLTNEEVERFREEMEGATGVTQEYADEANKQYGLMDKMKQAWSELTFKVGSMLEPLEGVFGAMTALGPVMIMFSTGMGKAAFATAAHTTSLVAHRIATWASFAATTALTAATTALGVALKVALGPIGWVILAVGALTGAGVALWKNWEAVEEKCLEIFGSIKNYILDTFNDITSGVVKTWGNIRDFFWGILRTIKGLFTDTWGTIKDTTKTAFEGIAHFMLWPIEKAANAIIGSLNLVVKGLNALISGANLIPGIDLPKVPEIPSWEAPELELKKGGIIRKRTLAMLGEEGPEAVVPLSRVELRNMLSPALTAQAASPPGEVSSQTINLSVNVAELHVREEADVERVAEELVGLIRLHTGVNT